MEDEENEESKNQQEVIVNESLIMDLREYLQVKTGIYYFKHIRTVSDNIQVTCPFHKQGQESKPSAYIKTNGDVYASAGTFHCFTCGETMGLSTVMERILGSLYDENEVEGRFGLKTLSAVSAIQQLRRTATFAIPTEKPTYNAEELRKYDVYNEYLAHRQIGPEIAKKYSIGYDSISRQITFPLRDINRYCIGIGRRSIDYKRYMYPPKMVKPLYRSL